MKNYLKKVLLAAALACLLFMALVGCAGESHRFTSFSLEWLDKPYVAGQECEITIAEQGGSADSYLIYEKIGSGEETQKASLVDAQKFTVKFQKEGEHTITVVPFVDGVESRSKSIVFSVVKDEFIIVNNIVELKVGDKFSISEMPVYYPAIDGIFTVNIDSYGDDSCVGRDGGSNNVLVAKKASQQPVGVVFSVEGRPELKSKIYFKIAEGEEGGSRELTNFIVDSVWQEDSHYQKGDIVPFQCIAYTGMEEPDGYNVYRYLDGAYQELKEGDGLSVRNVFGNIYYCVDIVETKQEHLRFYAVSDGEELGIFTDVTLNLSFDVLPEEIVVADIIDGNIVLCIGDVFEIQAEVLPEKASDKSLEYEIVSGSEYISLSGNKVAAEKAAGDGEDAVAVVKVTTAANKSVFTEIVFNVVPIISSDVKINNTGELSQKIGDTQSVIFSVDGLSEYTHSVEWYIDDTLKFAGMDFEFDWEGILHAGEIQGKALIYLTIGELDLVLIRDFTLTLTSSIAIAEELPKDVLVGSEVALTPSTALANAAFYIRVLDVIEAKEVSNAALDSGQTFTYSFPEQGYYEIELQLKVGGTVKEIIRTHQIDVKLTYSHEIYNLWIDGYNSGSVDGDGKTVYLPYIMWNYLGEDLIYDVEFSRGEESKVFSSNNTSHKDYFTARGFKLPSGSGGLFGFASQGWNVKVKTSLSNRYTDAISSTAMNEAAGVYFDELLGAGSVLGNRYIANILELGDLLSYLMVLRPEEYFNGDECDITLYFAVQFDDLDESVRALYAHPYNVELENEIFANAMKAFYAACYSYVNYSVSGIVLQEVGGNAVNLKFSVQERPVGNSTGDGGEYILQDTQYKSDIPRGESNQVFPINARDSSFSVSTGEQLLAAVKAGFKPQPLTDSAAERLYNKAKAVLNEILDSSMTDAEKVRAIYHYLAANVAYDHDLVADYAERLASAETSEEEQLIRDEILQNTSFYLEGVFDHNLAVCDGISKAFALLCGIENIPVLVVTGTATTPNGDIGHAWNMVLLDGQWYYVDATWGRGEQLQPNGKIHITINESYLAVGGNKFSQHNHVGEIPVAAPANYKFESLMDNSALFSFLPMDASAYGNEENEWSEYVIAA